eukprot:3014024-Rhodomonas_salina.2
MVLLADLWGGLWMESVCIGQYSVLCCNGTELSLMRISDYAHTIFSFGPRLSPAPARHHIRHGNSIASLHATCRFESY